jgi:hypothetical protein
MWLWKVFAGLFAMYVLIGLLCGVMTNLYFGTNETTLVSLLMTPETPAYTNPVGGITQTYSVTAAYMGAVYQMMFLDFPIFSGEFAIVRVLLLSVSIGVLIALVVGAIKPY